MLKNVPSLAVLAGLLLATPAVALAQPLEGTDANPTPHKLGKTTLAGRVSWGDGSLTVNGVKIESGPLLALLKSLNGKFVSLKGTIAQGDVIDSMKVASVKGVNPSKTKPADVLQGPDADALAMTKVEAGRGIDVIGQSRNGEWLKVKIDENDGQAEPGWVKATDLQLGGDTPAATNAKRKIAGVVAATTDQVTVNGVKVTNEPFVQILRGADGRSVTLEGFVTKTNAGESVKVTSLLALNEPAQNRAVKIRQRAEERAPQLGAPVAAGAPVAITGMTPDGVWFTTIVAEGDMREPGFVKASDVVIGTRVEPRRVEPRRPADTTGLNGALRVPTR